MNSLCEALISSHICTQYMENIVWAFFSPSFEAIDLIFLEGGIKKAFPITYSQWRNKSIAIFTQRINYGNEQMG